MDLNTLLTTTLRSTLIRTFSEVVEKSVATFKMVLLRTTQTTRSNDIKLFQTSSNHLVYQDMYTFKNDFYRVQTNVVSVNL